MQQEVGWGACAPALLLVLILLDSPHPLPAFPVPLLPSSLYSGPSSLGLPPAAPSEDISSSLGHFALLFASLGPPLRWYLVS